MATGAGGGVDQLTPLEALELEDDDEGDGVFGQRRDPRLHLMKKNKTKENQLRGTRLPWQVSFFLCRGGRWRPYRIFSSFFLGRHDDRVHWIRSKTKTGEGQGVWFLFLVFFCFWGGGPLLFRFIWFFIRKIGPFWWPVPRLGWSWTKKNQKKSSANIWPIEDNIKNSANNLRKKNPWPEVMEHGDEMK